MSSTFWVSISILIRWSQVNNTNYTNSNNYSSDKFAAPTPSMHNNIGLKDWSIEYVVTSLVEAILSECTIQFKHLSMHVLYTYMYIYIYILLFIYCPCIHSYHIMKLIRSCRPQLHMDDVSLNQTYIWLLPQDG